LTRREYDLKIDWVDPVNYGKRWGWIEKHCVTLERKDELSFNFHVNPTAIKKIDLAEVWLMNFWSPDLKFWEVWAGWFDV
jgi:hypothetical protein